MAIGDREGVECTTIEDCVVDGFIPHEIKSTPTYSSILKKGGTGAHGYALAAAALSSVPATYKMPPAKRAPAKRVTCDPIRLYLDSAATYGSRRSSLDGVFGIMLVVLLVSVVASFDGVSVLAAAAAPAMHRLL